MARVQPKRQQTAARGRASPPQSPGGPGSLAAIHEDVIACERCPRLRRYCAEVAVTKRRAYRDSEYWGRPVPGFGDPRTRLWVVGLAPAAHGGNRTGRVFTGDSSGDWLFRALHGAGFARVPHSIGRDDGQELRGAYVSAVARCAPPANKPRPAELAHCRPFLERELGALAQLRIVVPLGKIAFDAVLRLLEDSGYAVPRPRPRFGHSARCHLGPVAGSQRRPLVILASYHPSRQNTQTGKLTRPMLDGIFATVREMLSES